MSLNKWIGVGFLAAKPELFYSQAGTTFCKFCIAINSKIKDNKTTDFINCVAFGNQAEVIDKYFDKGMPIAVVGTLKNNNFVDTSGVKHYSYNVTVNEISFCGGAKRKPQPDKDTGFDGKVNEEMTNTQTVNNMTEELIDLLRYGEEI